MDMALIMARVALALVLGSAALGKLANVTGAAESAQSLGLPRPLAGVVGPTLPVVELSVAAFLLPGRTARPAAITAAIMLLAFTVLLLVNLAQGRRPQCNCFGAASSRPIDRWSVLRNLFLVALATGIAFAGPGPGAAAFLSRHIDTLDHLRVMTIALGAVVGVQAILIVQLWRRGGRSAPDVADATEKAAGLPIGAMAPAFDLTDLEGTRHSLQAFLELDRPVLVAFVDPKCVPCTALLPELSDWQTAYSESLSIITVSRGPVAANRHKLGDLTLAPVLLQANEEVAAAYRYPGTPAAILLSTDGRVAAPMAVGAHEIRSLLESALTAAAAAAPTPDPPAVGEPAPIFALPGLEGETVHLIEQRGRLTLVLYWSPTCVYCRELRGDLVALDKASASGEGMRLVVVSSGSLKANRSDGFASPVAIDDGQLTRRALGFSGSPQALLIDAQGNVASELAEGPTAIIELIHWAESLAAAAGRLEGLVSRRKIPVSASPGPGERYGTEADEADDERGSR